MLVPAIEQSGQVLKQVLPKSGWVAIPMMVDSGESRFCFTGDNAASAHFHLSFFNSLSIRSVHQGLPGPNPNPIVL